MSLRLKSLSALAGAVLSVFAGGWTLGAAESVKRSHFLDTSEDWFSDAAQSVHTIRATLEFKTIWHPIDA